MKCSFCGTEIPVGTGKMSVKKDGKILWFCSSKCEKNLLKVGRKPAKLFWTEEGQNAKQVALTALKHSEEKQVEEEKAENAEKKASKSAAEKVASKKAPAKK